MLAKVGLAEKVSHHKGTEKGRGARRNTSSLSFHCLRHTTTSVLKNKGVSHAIAMELIGHDSEAVTGGNAPTHKWNRDTSFFGELTPAITPMRKR